MTIRSLAALVIRLVSIVLLLYTIAPVASIFVFRRMIRNMFGGTIPPGANLTAEVGSTKIPVSSFAEFVTVQITAAAIFLTLGLILFFMARRIANFICRGIE